MRVPSRHAAACVALAIAGVPIGCSKTPPRFPTTTERGTVARRPPGVPIERPFAPSTSASHDVRTRVLTPPLDVREAQRLVASFFRAVRTEDFRALEPLLTADAAQQSSAGRELRGAREYWQRRLARLDYGALPEGTLFREQDIEIRREDDEASGPPRGDGASGGVPGQGELVLGVPVLITHAGAARLFGPRLTFVFVEQEGHLLITRILEDFQLL